MLRQEADAEGGREASNLTISSRKLMQWLRDYGELMRYNSGIALPQPALTALHCWTCAEVYFVLASAMAQLYNT